MWTTRATWIALALTILLLARGLPAETFFVGDPGVKLIAARAAISHPAAPFEIALPEIAHERVAFVEPFFELHDEHAHALTSEVFPVLTAPFIAAFGIRGAYVLPALGFLLAVWSSARLAAALGSTSPPATVVMLSVALGTPLLFYGLEYWEHAPAVAIASLATTVLIKDTTTEDTGGHGMSRPLLAGALFGISILLRPEAAWFFAAVVASSPLLKSPPRWSALGLACAGIALAVAPLAIYSLAHFGTMAPPHLETQADLLTIGWLNTRAGIITAWFAPDSLRGAAPWGVALVLMALSGLVRAGGRWNAARFCAGVVFLDVVLVVMTAPNDGGGQWGPRYLLFAFVPASLLLASAADTINRRTTAGIAVLLVLLAAGAWVQRSGYRELRGTKILYGHVLDLVRRQVPAGGYAVTDLWWLDQVAAAATADRTILFTAGERDRRDALRRLYGAGVEALTAFVSRDESAGLSTWSGDPCYELAGQTEIATRKLVAITLKRRPNCL